MGPKILGAFFRGVTDCVLTGKGTAKSHKALVEQLVGSADGSLTPTRPGVSKRASESLGALATLTTNSWSYCRRRYGTDALGH